MGAGLGGGQIARALRGCHCILLDKLRLKRALRSAKFRGLKAPRHFHAQISVTSVYSQPITFLHPH